MERARKMVIVPEDQLNRMQNMQLANTENTVQTQGDNLSRLDSEMYEILNSKKYSDEREKCKHYLQALRRYLFFVKENERNEEKAMRELSETLEGSVAEANEEQRREEEYNMQAPLSHETIVDGVAKAQRSKARRLLRHWQTTNRISWDDTGTVSIDGQPINRSNIIELLNDVLAKKN